MLLICIQSHALGEQTLAQRPNAPEHFQTNMKSNTGKTTIEIDAAVFVPDGAGVRCCAAPVQQGRIAGHGGRRLWAGSL